MPRSIVQERVPRYRNLQHVFGRTAIWIRVSKRDERGRERENGGKPWSLRAVKTMVPVSSPTRHSAILVGRSCTEAARPLSSTVLELNTWAVRVWPLVPGFSRSTFVNTGFHIAPPPPPCCRAVAMPAIEYPNPKIEGPIEILNPSNQTERYGTRPRF